MIDLPATPQTVLAKVIVPAQCDARSSNGTPLFRVACPDCGAVRLADKRRIGRPCKACGPKRRVTHGLSEHPLYRKLKNIQARCQYATASNFAYYGGRGITVCDEWRHNPEAFVVWCEANGYRDGLEIDRIDNDGPYAPWNCRFVTHAENSRRRTPVKLDEGMAMRIRAEFARHSGSLSSLAKRLELPYMAVWHVVRGSSWREVA